MTKEELELLITTGFSDRGKTIELVETHISWVLLTPHFAFKIKRPVKYSFLDFSSIEKRRLYCEKEVVLNNRLSEDIYLGVLPIWRYNDRFTIGDQGPGEIIDYTVHMKKLDPNSRMDKLLNQRSVTFEQLKPLSEKLVNFHKEAVIIHDSDYRVVAGKFSDLLLEATFLDTAIENKSSSLIEQAVNISDTFISQHEALLKQRIADGYVRDVHGDLHTRNIFLLEDPVIFDCIEFSDELRQIDILNELAFFCMDMDAHGYQEEANSFFNYYNHQFPVALNADEQNLFVYYKAYRANVRAKVNSLRAKSATSHEEKNAALLQVDKYLKLMMSYIDVLTHNAPTLLSRQSASDSA